jgi:hypothetical protein
MDIHPLDLLLLSSVSFLQLLLTETILMLNIVEIWPENELKTSLQVNFHQ